MKQFKTLLAIFLLGGLFLTSCSKSSDNTPNPTDESPSMNFVGQTGYVSGDVTLPVDQPFLVGINAFQNPTTKEKLVRFTVTRVVNNSPETVKDTVINASTITINISGVSASTAGTEKWYFRVTDAKNKFRELNFTITTTAPAGPINTYSQKILGGQDNTIGSSFASIDGSIYSLAEAKTNSAKVDWMYYNGAQNHATLAAPIDPTAAEVFNDLNGNGPASWTVRNATKFKTVTVDFASVTDDSQIVTAATGATDTKVINLSVGKVIAFIAANGKMGLIHVDDITGFASGTMTISVKVQQ